MPIPVDTARVRRAEEVVLARAHRRPDLGRPRNAEAVQRLVEVHAAAVHPLLEVDEAPASG